MNFRPALSSKLFLVWFTKFVLCFALLAAALGTSHPVQAAPISPDGKIDLPGNGPIVFSPPTLADITGDGKPEILVGTNDGKVIAIGHTSGNSLTMLWSFDTGPVMGGATTIRGAISVGDLDGDGSPEIVAPLGDIFSTNSIGGIVALNAQGQLLWTYRSFDHLGPATAPDGLPDGIVGAPALGDLDNDGKLEIVFGGFDMRIQVLRSDGTTAPGWPRFVRDTIWSSPALADLDNDGFLEIVIGIDTHLEGPPFNTPDGGGLYVMNYDGTDLPGWPKFIDQAIYSSPAIGDLDGNGTLEIVHGTSEFYANPGAGYKIYTWDVNGNLLWTGNTGGYVRSSPALGDINGDGTFEVVANSLEDAKTYAWRHDGVPLWSVQPLDYLGQWRPLSESPVIAAYTNDGQNDVLTNVLWEAAVIDGATGQQLTGTSVADSRPSYVSGSTASTNVPALGDIDGDGFLELVVASANNAGPIAQVVYWNLPTPATPESTPWPMFSQNPAHTGYLARPAALDAEVVSHSLPDVAQPGSSYQLSVTFKNTGSENWTPNTVQLKSVSGVAPLLVDLPGDVAPGQTVTLQFPWQAPAQPGYQDVSWRLVNPGTSAEFGRSAYKKVKLGNQPALQVLTAEGIYAGGLATAALPGPAGLTNWPSALSWKLLDDSRGYRLLDQFGAVWAGGNAMPLVAPSARTDMREIILGANNISQWLLTNSGVIFGCDPNDCVRSFNPTPPTNIAARSFVLTPDGRGVYVVDAFGNLYGGGTAPGLPTAPGFPTAADIIIRMKLTKDGQGYYLLDKYGQVHAGGNAPALAPGYQPQLGVDWAIDFELTDDEKGYYLLVRDGTILPGGNAEPLTVNVPPVKSADFARDLELIDSRRSAPLPSLGIKTQQQNKFIAEGDQRSLSFQNTVQNTGPMAVDWTVTANWITGGNLPSVRVNPANGVLQPGASQTVSIVIPNMGDENLGTYQLEITARAAAAGGEATQTSTLSIEVVDTVFDTYLPSTLR